MNQEDHKNLKALVRTMYDYQAMRIVTGIRMRFKKNEEKMAEEFMDDAEISEKDYDAVNYTYETSKRVEARLSKEIKSIIKKEPIYEKFLIKVLGCGELMSAAILCEFDIEKAATVSKLWQFAGLNPGMVRGKKILNITKKTDLAKYEVVKKYKNQRGEECAIILSDEMIRGDKKKTGFISPFNSWIRTKLCGTLADCMIKANGNPNPDKINYPVKYYYPYKTRLEQEENTVTHIGKETAWKDVSKGHRDRAAKRYMIKMFLKDLYVEWRTIEGLSVRPPYQEEYLGHKHE
jgi:hypothetical protein